MKKRCSRCGEEKILEDFYNSKREPDGKASWCKNCYKEYYSTPEQREVSRRRSLKFSRSKKGKQKQREYQKSVRGKDASRRYRESPKGKAARRRWFLRELKSGRVAVKALQQKMKNPHKVKARRDLSNALRDGRVSRPGVCECCDRECTPYGHHSDYSKPLDVIWLCSRCHSEIHHQFQT